MKGVSSYRRIHILILLAKDPDLSLQEIAGQLKWNLKTTAEHVRRLVAAGLAVKGSRQGDVPHRLTKRGIVVLKFLRNLD